MSTRYHNVARSAAEGRLCARVARRCYLIYRVAFTDEPDGANLQLGDPASASPDERGAKSRGAGNI
jgi:hypothetical protein